MQVGAAGSHAHAAMQQVAQSAQAMGDILQTATDAKQDISGKLIGMSAEATVEADKANRSKIDFQA